MGKERPPVNANYRSFFGMTREAFPTELSLKDILETPDIAAIKQRFDYTLRLGAIAIVTGEVGSGKSTALRYVVSKLHPSEYRTVWITACSGSILEFYRLLLAEMGIHMAGPQKAIMIRLIKKSVREIVVEKKMKIVLIVDEASLMRLEVFAELHTITQFEQDSKPWLPIILGRKDQPDRQAHVSDITSPSFKDSDAKPYGTGQQTRNARVSFPPYLFNRDHYIHFRRSGHYSHSSRLRRNIKKSQPPREGLSDSRSGLSVQGRIRRSCQARCYRNLLITQYRAGKPGSD